MDKIRFKLEDDGEFLESHYKDRDRLVEFQVERDGMRHSKLHRIQILALSKVIN